MDRHILTYENFNAILSLQGIAEFQYTSIDGTYTLKIFEEDSFLLILPSGKHFIADYEFLYEPGDNYQLDQYEKGSVKNWIIGCVQSTLN